jgi:hypothetical protein
MTDAVADDAPLRLDRRQPPEGYTQEEWDAMLKCSDILDFPVPPSRHPYRRDIGVPIPDVPVEHRSGSNGTDKGLQMRVPNMTYVIRCGPFVKIGMTSCIHTRLRAMESTNPHDLVVVSLLAGGRRVEGALHKRFAAQRHRDEWFREEGPLADWIAEGCPL